MPSRASGVGATRPGRSEALSFLDTEDITRQSSEITTDIVVEHPARVAWRDELERRTAAHRETRARAYERRALQREHYGCTVPARKRRMPGGHVVVPAHAHDGHADGVTERTARASGTWHRARARGQRERFTRVRECATTEELRIECVCCGVVDGKAARCGASLVCLRCRGHRAAKIRARFLRARASKLAEARAQGRLVRRRKGGRWGERLVTLTVPHHDRDTVRGRINLVLAAWPQFLKWLNAWGRAQGGGIEFVRALEWTPGADALGHPHVHVWIYSPYLPQDFASAWWREALERAGLGLGEDEELLDVDIRGASNADVAQELVKYITKDIGSDGRYVAPEVYAEVYAALDGRRPVQASSGFLARGDAPPECPHCGAVYSRRVRVIRPDGGEPEHAADDCARLDAARGPPGRRDDEMQASYAERTAAGSGCGARARECAVCTATGREARLTRRSLDGRTLVTLCARCRSHVGPRRVPLDQLAREVAASLCGGGQG